MAPRDALALKLVKFVPNRDIAAVKRELLKSDNDGLAKLNTRAEVQEEEFIKKTAKDVIVVPLLTNVPVKYVLPNPGQVMAGRLPIRDVSSKFPTFDAWFAFPDLSLHCVILRLLSIVSVERSAESNHNVQLEKQVG